MTSSFTGTTNTIPLPPLGNKLTCKGWHQEAALRCLLNNLHPEVAEDRENLIVYGGIGKAARNFSCLEKIIECLRNLENDQTLLIQSGKPVGILPSSPHSPRVLLANSNLVPAWSNWETFYDLEKKGLTMYGQMTAGSWIYIGTQGILQGTYETFMAAAQKHYGKNQSLKGKLVLSAGLGGMGGAQPLAVKLAEGVFFGVDVCEDRLKKRLQDRYLDAIAPSFETCLELALKAKAEKRAFSVATVGHAALFYRYILEKNILPDFVTDQTSAHDPLSGYVPNTLTNSQAPLLRKENPKEYQRLAYHSMKDHVETMLEFQKRGAFVFDYGNNLREGAHLGGLEKEKAFSFPGFVPAYIRPLFCEGSGPFRFIALSGDPKDIEILDEALVTLFPEDKKLAKWIYKAREFVSFQGLPSRICWLNFQQRKVAGLLFNKLVRENKVSAPIVIGRDHLDCGSVASPYRETENMKDGSDAISDWPILNAFINISNGASWVSFHHGGGVGMGYSQHAGMAIVADGTHEMEMRLSLVLNSDPGMGILRHADAGYEIAQEASQKISSSKDLIIPFSSNFNFPSL